MIEATWTSHRKKSLLDPRTKLLLILIESVLVLSTAGGSRLFWFRVAFAFLPFLLLLTAKRYRICLLGLIVLSAIYFLECTAFPHVKGVMANMLLIIIMLVNRFLPTYMMGLYVINTTTVSEFKAAMEKLHMPDAITIREERNSICAAMKMRGIRFGGGKVGKVLEYRIVPIITCVAKIGEELSASAITRGLGKQKKRTNICQIGLGWADYVIFLFVVLTLIYWLLGVLA